MIPQVLGMMVIIAADRQRHTRRSYLELFGAIWSNTWSCVEGRGACCWRGRGRGDWLSLERAEKAEKAEMKKESGSKESSSQLLNY